MAVVINQGPAPLGGLIPALINEAQNRATFYVNVENCMVVKGWKVVQLSEEDGGALGRLTSNNLRTWLEGVVGAAQPQGSVVRQFQNDAARGDTIFGGTPRVAHRQNLSLRAVSLDNLPEYPRFPPPSTRGRTVGVSLRSDELTGLPEGTALVIVRLVGTGQTNGVGFHFERMRSFANPAVIATRRIDPVEHFFASVPWSNFRGAANERREATFAFPVVPGRWGISAKMNTLSFCLGAPAFEIQAGEVVFLGTFDVASETLGPQMALDPAAQYLGPSNPVVERLRPAQWTNGVTMPCRGGFTYALEIPGAPFEPGYHDGGAPGAPVTAPY